MKHLAATSKKEFLFNQVLFRNIDFTMQEFTGNKDIAYYLPQGGLVPFPWVKIALDGSRRFTISKKHKDEKKVYQALEKGLKILRERGVIDRFLRESGFYREKTEGRETLAVDN